MSKEFRFFKTDSMAVLLFVLRLMVQSTSSTAGTLCYMDVS